MKAEKTRKMIDGLKSAFRVTAEDFIFEELSELEAKAAKWDMIQWAIDSEVEFVEVEDGGDFEIALYSQDIDRLEELYKEREQING